METSFSTYSGGDFLLFYAALLAAAVVAGFWIPGFLRSDGQRGSVNDRHELAYLARGAGRMTESVIAQLLGISALVVGAKNKLRATNSSAGEYRAEQALLRKHGDFGLTEAHKAIKPYAADVDADLVRKGLMQDKGTRWQMRFMSTVPYLVLLGVGFYRRSAGVAEGEPVGFLTALMVLTFVLGVVRFAKYDPRTRAGQEALDEARSTHVRLQRAPTPPELGFGVALFGTAILVGTPYSQLHAMSRSAVGDGSGGYYADGGGGGEGGSGCGGGCGGCGG